MTTQEISRPVNQGTPVLQAFPSATNDEGEPNNNTTFDSFKTKLPSSDSQSAVVSAVQASETDPGNSTTVSGSHTGVPQRNKTTPTLNIPSASPTAAPPASPAKQDGGGGGGGGLGTGAKAGIAVGTTLGVLALIAFIFFCLRRRKSKRKTAGGYYDDAPGRSNDLREKEAGVGIAAIPVSASPTDDGNGHASGDAALIGRGKSARVVDGSYIEDGDRVGRHATTGHASPAATGAGMARKPVGHRSVSDEEREGRNGAVSSQGQVLNNEERARWDEEERRLDEDIAEAERRRLA